MAEVNNFPGIVSPRRMPFILNFFLCCVVWVKRGGMKRWLAIVDILCVNLKIITFIFYSL
jgi:hypothetical protein